MRRQHPELVVGGFTLAVALPSALGELLTDAAVLAASLVCFYVSYLEGEAFLRVLCVLFCALSHCFFL